MTPRDRSEGRQRRLYGSEKVPPNQHQHRGQQESGSGDEVRRPACASQTLHHDKSITRTRSESDLIRAIAKRKSEDALSVDDDSSSSDESEDSMDEEYDGKRATSLRSVATEDEERNARAVKDGVLLVVDEHCDKKGGGEGETESPVPSCEQESLCTPASSRLGLEEGGSLKHSIASEKSGTVASQVPSETQSCAATSTDSPLKDGATKASISKSEPHSLDSFSADEVTSTTSLMGEDPVDLEYLLHENDLLTNALDHVSLERDFLAQDNWNLRMELESLRNQMRFMMTMSGAPMKNCDGDILQEFNQRPSPTRSCNTMLDSLPEECHHDGLIMEE